MPETVLIVAHGHPEISPGGGELAAHALFDQLRRRDGVKAYFLAWAGSAARRRGGTPFSTFRGRPDEILFATESFDHFLFSQPTDITDQFSLLLKQLKPDIIHMHHYSKVGLELIAIARLVNPSVRIIVTLHEYLAICHNHGQMIKTGSGVLCEEANVHDCSACFLDIPPSEFLLRKFFIRSHLDKVDLFIAPSKFLKQRYVAWGLPARQIVVVENGTTLVEPLPLPRPRAQRERRATFGFFGQINVYKGVLELLRAIEYISRAPEHLSADIRLVIHGANVEMNPPDFVEEFNSLLERTGDRVQFAGPYTRNTLGRLMADVDWVVMPSIWWENSPLVIQEAFAHRRPVICSNIGGMAEKVRWGKDGYHFEVGNPFEIANMMVRLAGDDGIWDQLQKTIQHPLSIEASASEHLELYRGDLGALPQ